MNLQLPLTSLDLSLHQKHCSPLYESIYGAGCLVRPKVMLVFMNPTARNISAAANWQGIRAPWLGVRHTWKLLASLKLISDSLASEIYARQLSTWDEAFSEKIYQHVAAQKLYITNLAKCTQPDARHLPNSIFKDYLSQMFREIDSLKPDKIVTLGNQVSSVLLQKPISVSSYPTTEFEILVIAGKKYQVYPTYYPVGQGQRNLSKAIHRIQSILT